MQDFQADILFASYLGGTHSTLVQPVFGFPAVAVIFLSLLLFANNAGMNYSTRIWAMRMKKTFSFNNSWWKPPKSLDPAANLIDYLFLRSIH